MLLVYYVIIKYEWSRSHPAKEAVAEWNQFLLSCWMALEAKGVIYLLSLIFAVLLFQYHWLQNSKLGK